MPSESVTFAKQVELIMTMIGADEVWAFMAQVEPLAKAPSDYATQVLASVEHEATELEPV
jgi:hypothetical protein